ncbi:hypoxanthine phosphoribosyltransferase [Mangrovibacterium marinum]|uniref:Hypoxanthine phosphoribosyltransferase n=1 Tax=Mangrovibacterium marinum TaxID=1639118 RepID=A0A2T5BYC7_9BACT|nr:hypoxanthine phosphoribosyltransferase [Mangrovibacterium marinum]PTN07223.1 hypoxanthine phosphoribosyltransferase [Mangrovibacterium marinum]
MKKISILDKDFELFIPYEKIRAVIEDMAEKMNQTLEGKNPLFLCILNGSFMFAAEVFKRISLLDAEISFVKLASYEGTSTTGTVKELIGLNEDLSGRTVIVLEDIVDTGITIDKVIDQLQAMNPADLQIATLLLKPDALKKDVKLDYVGLEIPNEFIVGYGLDYDGRGRNLIDIYKVVE